MKSLAYQNAVTNNALRQSEMQIVGSFISGVVDREDNFFTQKIVITSAEQMRDPFAQAAWKAIEVCAERGDGPTPAMIASTMITEGLLGDIPAEAYDEAFASLADRLKMYAETGATTTKSWKRMESIHYARLQQDQAESVVANLQATMARLDGRTRVEKLLDVRKVIDEALDSERVDGETITYERSLEVLAQMPQEMAAQVGKKFVRLPPHFGVVARSIGALQPKEMSVFSAPTGVGKSMFLGMTGEWNAMAQGIRVLHWSGEDDRDLLLRRAAARWTPDTVYTELTQGDVRGRLAQYAQIISHYHEQNGGEIRYEHRPLIGGTELVLMLSSILERAQAEGRPYGLVIIDYLQKIAFYKDAKVYGNETLAVQYTADRLRALAGTFNCHVMIGSQVTKEADGGLKIAWGKAVGDKSQVHLQGTREYAATELNVYEVYKKIGDTINKDKAIRLVKEGDPMPYMLIHSEKANRARPIQERLVILGASQKIMCPEFYAAVQKDPNKEFESERFHLAGQTEIDDYELVTQRQKLLMEQADDVWKTHEAAKTARKGKKGKQEDGYVPW